MNDIEKLMFLVGTERSGIMVSMMDKKIYETWNIRDYRFYERKPTEIDGDWGARWKKYYHRK